MVWARCRFRYIAMTLLLLLLMSTTVTAIVFDMELNNKLPPDRVAEAVAATADRSVVVAGDSSLCSRLERWMHQQCNKLIYKANIVHIVHCCDLQSRSPSLVDRARFENRTINKSNCLIDQILPVPRQQLAADNLQGNQLLRCFVIDYLTYIWTCSHSYYNFHAVD